MVEYLKPGDRIGAFAEIKDGEVKFLGYGEYLGDFETDDPKCMTAKLKLDDGVEAMGYQCVWGSEARVRREVGNRKLVPISLEDSCRLLLKRRLATQGNASSLFNLRLSIAAQFSKVAASVQQVTHERVGDVLDPIVDIILPAISICMAGSMAAFLNQKELSTQAAELTEKQKGSPSEIFKYIQENLQVNPDTIRQFKAIVKDIEVLCQKWLPDHKIDFLPKELGDLIDKGLDETPA